MAIDLSPDLIELERTAGAKIQADTLTVETAQAAQAGIVAHAEVTEQKRIDIEAELKHVVRHSDE